MTTKSTSARLFQQACRARTDSLRRLPASRAIHQHATSTSSISFLTAAPRTQPPRPRILKEASICHPVTKRTFSHATRHRKAIINPRLDEDGNEMEIEITPRAANRLTQLMTSDSSPNLCLRVSVESGGCHGFQYLMSLTDLSKTSSEEDTVFEGPGGAKVVMDEPSLELLKGSKVDYTMELIGSQFKVVGNPRASSSCGCGTSFDIQL